MHPETSTRRSSIDSDQMASSPAYPYKNTTATDMSTLLLPFFSASALNLIAHKKIKICICSFSPANRPFMRLFKAYGVVA
jgi:hypothetical protein